MSPREAAVTGLLDEHELDALIGCSYEALCYFAGTDIRSQLLIPERMAFLIATARAIRDWWSATSKDRRPETSPG